MLTFHIDWVSILTLVVTILLPVIVGLITTEETNANRKAIYLAGLSAISGFGSEVLTALHDHVAYDAGVGLIKFVGILVVAIALHYGFWKPTGVASAAQSFGTSSDGTPSITSLPEHSTETPVINQADAPDPSLDDSPATTSS